MPSGHFPAVLMFIGGLKSTTVYYVAARALLAPSANVHDDDASLQLYANCVGTFLARNISIDKGLVRDNSSFDGCLALLLAGTTP